MKNLKNIETTNASSVKAAGFSEPNQRDLEVLEMIKAGDGRSFSYIYRKYQPFIRHYVYQRVSNPRTADDLVQDIMMKVWKNLDKYQVNYTFNSWVWRIVKNHVVDHHRRKKNMVLSTASNFTITCEDFDTDNGGENVFIPENSLEGGDMRADRVIGEKERSRMVRAMLNHVSDKERRMIEMFYFEDKSYEEIATEFEMPLGTLKGTLSRAKDKMRKAFAGTEVNELLYS